MSIKILVFGGLGNQLFQFAFGESLRMTYKNLDVKYIDLTEYATTKRKWELGFLDIKPSKINKIEIFYIFFKRIINSKFNKLTSKFFYFGIINEKQQKYIHDFLIKEKSFIIDGYWQSEEYFSEIKNEIKNMFEINNHNPKINSKEEKVAVHIRLGDYVHTKEGREKHLVCDIGWYKNAINYLKNINKELKFKVFSDNKNLLKNEFRHYQNLEINDSNYSESAHKELYEMSKCDHFIISNSTYSWWASYLGEKKGSKIIAPKYWYKNIKTKNIPLFRKNWILL